MKMKKVYVIPTLLGLLLAGCDESKMDLSSINTSPDFAVKVKENENRLKLFQHVSHEDNEETNILSINKVESITSAYSYKWFLNESKGYTFEKLHNEETDPYIGKSSLGNGLGFFKYAFYVKNVSDSRVNYLMNVGLNENIKPAGSDVGMDEYLRLMIFEGDKTPVIYARRSKSRYDASHETYKEYVSGPEGTANYFGEAELFESDSVLATLTNSLKIGEYRMYTLLFWLEGEDNECKDLPDEASLRIGATINAYPKQIEEAD